MDSNTILSLSVITSITVIFIGGMIVFGNVAHTAFSQNARQGSPKSFGLMFQRGNFLRIVTVLAVVVAVVMLALLGRLGEGAAALLSGIAGYVLGGWEKASTKEAAETEKDESRT